MNPPLRNALEHPIEVLSPLNPRAAQIVHSGLRSMLGGYEDIGFMKDVLGPELGHQASTLWDHLEGVRLYRRKR